jgi:O-acetyl-ADP-ribose deacetylase (regulator of RNase III)
MTTTTTTTILVTGDRRWTHPDRLAQVLDQAAAEAAGPVRLLVGDCPTGADRHAVRWARHRGVAFEVFPARWQQMAAEGKPRRAAGPLRNLAMLNALDQAPGERLVVAFHDDLGRSRGTRQLVRAARARGYPVTLVTGTGRELLPASTAASAGGGRLEVRTGDLFASSAHTLVNPVNTAGVMGAGLAAEFRRRFPDLDADYQRRCATGQVRLGQPYLYRTAAGVQVINFPTKGHWRQPSQLADLDQGLAYLTAHAADWQLGSLAMPALGAGLGGLSWEQVGPLLYRYLHDLGVPVLLHAPPGTPPERASIGYLAHLARQQPGVAGPAEELAAAAVGYARRGVPVLPLHYLVQRARAGGVTVGCSCRAPDCGQVGKHPLAALVPHGVKDASCDPTVVAAWWRRFPQANIGLATGHLFDALDVDGPEGAAALRAFTAEHGLELPAGPLVRTGSGGGGWHLYLARTGLGNPSPRGLTHVDWRGRGGYVVAPPSRHASGTRYRFLRDLDAPLVAVPQALRQLLEPAPDQRPSLTDHRLSAGRGHPYAVAALEGECQRVAGTSPGSRQRNRSLYRAGLRLFGYVAGGLLDHAEVEQRLQQAARGCGLGQREAAATIRSAATVGLAHPKGVPDQRPTAARPPTGRSQREPRARQRPEDRDRHG